MCRITVSYAPHISRLRLLQVPAPLRQMPWLESAAHLDAADVVAAELKELKADEVLPLVRRAAAAGHAGLLNTLLDAPALGKGSVRRVFLLALAVLIDRCCARSRCKMKRFTLRSRWPAPTATTQS